jgi:hypothetical protein
VKGGLEAGVMTMGVGDAGGVGVMMTKGGLVSRDMVACVDCSGLVGGEIVVTKVDGGVVRGALFGVVDSFVEEVSPMEKVPARERAIDPGSDGALAEGQSLPEQQ